METFDAIVIGGGAIGASCLFQLKQAGLGRTLLLEKMGGFGRGATGSWGSLVRMFHRHPVTALSASRSVPFYLNFEKHVGQAFQWTPTGSLYFLKEAELAEFAGQLESLRSSGLEFELVGAREGKKRFRDFSWYEDDVAIYESKAGVACPRSTTEAFIQAARKQGARVALNAEVVEIICRNQRVTGVRTASGVTYECGQLIVASGVWTNPLLEKIGTKTDSFPKPLQLNRFCRHHGLVDHPFFLDKSTRTFGHPSQRGSFIGGYLGNEWEDAKHTVEHVSLFEANQAKQKISQRIPWVKNATLEGGIRVLESYTDSTIGIVERSKVYENLIVTSGWSCAGFTLAPEVGQRVARVATA